MATQKIEILAPAGDEKSAYAAINAGADAIYLGLTAFSARSSAQNFSLSQLEGVIKHAHILGVKVYVAMNTLVKDSEVESFIKDAVSVHNLGADAIIIQDIFLGAYLKKTYPQMCLHLSTQAGVCNALGAAYAKELGFSRVILARETKFKDVCEIAKIIETEVFIQGALCTCFSGQCYLSSFAGGNSGNRGKCKQPCRKKYSIDKKGYEEAAYRISLSDLSVGEDISKYIEAGVISFKIEGRMRRPEYVSAAVAYYKKITDGKNSEAALSDLKRTYNRGNYTKGLAFGQDKSFISSAVQGHIGEWLGTVSVVNGAYFCRTKSQCGGGDCFKILRDGKEVCGATFSASGKDGFYLKSSTRLKNGDKVFITTDVKLNERLLKGERKTVLEISARFAADERPVVCVNGKEYTADFIAERAKDSPLTKEQLIACFNKVASLPFSVRYKEIIIAGNTFVPASFLNAFRRKVYEEVCGDLCKKVDKIEKVVPVSAPVKKGINNNKCVISRSLSHLPADIGVLKPDNYFDDLSGLIKGFNGKKFLYLPPYMTGEETERIAPQLAIFDGVYSGGIYAASLSKKSGKSFFAGTGLNISNRVALCNIEADFVALSKEITTSEAAPLAAQNVFYLAGGDIQVMDLIYCPFGKSCKECDRRHIYTLTDEDGRKFPLRRYELSGCRFELYNCARLQCEKVGFGTLYDNTAQEAEVKGYTGGHTQKAVQ